MKIRIIFLILALVSLSHTPAFGIDFKIRGQWLMMFDAGQTRLLKSSRSGNIERRYTDDKFAAMQRIRLQLEAIASENLSATVQIQIGATAWGRASQGGALGADGNIIKVRQAYIDWAVPDLNMKNRIGLQFLSLPNKAGGPAILASRVAAAVSSFSLNDNLSVTAFWARPYNDNFEAASANQHSGYLDNMDLFSLGVNCRLDGFEINPWVMGGMIGKNTLWNGNGAMTNWGTAGNPLYTLNPYPVIRNRGGSISKPGDKAYGAMIWAGLPLSITIADSWNVEFDFNYGYVENMGNFDVYKGENVTINKKRASGERQGWLAKALIEYKMDICAPGIFGWYASGDDANPKNGSERIPSLAAYGNFTSFLGDTGYTLGTWYDASLDYAGTWGIGAQFRDLKILSDKLSHTLRATWWGGTNSPGMIKYMANAASFNDGWQNFDGPYLTTLDGLLEANLITVWSPYENFKIYNEFGYIANFMDNDAWEKAGNRDSSFSKQDAWKVQLSFMYSF